MKPKTKISFSFLDATHAGRLILIMALLIKERDSLTHSLTLLIVVDSLDRWLFLENAITIIADWHD